MRQWWAITWDQRCRGHDYLITLSYEPYDDHATSTPPGHIVHAESLAHETDNYVLR
jgi:hypothetical protein